MFEKASMNHNGLSKSCNFWQDYSNGLRNRNKHLFKYVFNIYYCERYFRIEWNAFIMVKNFMCITLLCHLSVVRHTNLCFMVELAARSKNIVRVIVWHASGSSATADELITNLWKQPFSNFALYLPALRAQIPCDNISVFSGM